MTEILEDIYRKQIGGQKVIEKVEKLVVKPDVSP